MNVRSAFFKWILALSLTIIGMTVAVTSDNGGKDNAVGSYLRAGSTHDVCRRNPASDYRVPFVITNIAVEDIGNGFVKYNYHSNDITNTIHYIKDVRNCRYRFRTDWIVGTRVTQSEFKIAVKEYLESLSNKDHVLYYLHGVNNDPAYTLEEAAEANTNYVVIPIQWRNWWGAGKISYEYDRNNNAPRMGKSLAQEFDIFTEVEYKQSIMCHSMGNYIFRVFAQNIEDKGHTVEKVFLNFFSVAADARMDMFSSDFNPAVSGLESSEGLEQELGIPAEEFAPNGGYAISRIAENTHVVYNLGDHALLIREAFQIGWGPNVRKALGKYGFEAENEMDDYFYDKVKFHDFGPVVEEFGVEHNYHWYDVSINLYEELGGESIVASINNQEKHFNLSEEKIKVESI